MVINYAEEVLAVYPNAKVNITAVWGVYSTVEIIDNDRYLGGAETSDEAWRNAWLHMIMRMKHSSRS